MLQRDDDVGYRAVVVETFGVTDALVDEELNDGAVDEGVEMGCVFGRDGDELAVDVDGAGRGVVDGLQGEGSALDPEGEGLVTLGGCRATLRRWGCRG